MNCECPLYESLAGTFAMIENAFDEDVRKCISAGMNAHLVKLLEMEKVIVVISKYNKR